MGRAMVVPMSRWKESSTGTTWLATDLRLMEFKASRMCNSSEACRAA